MSIKDLTQKLLANFGITLIKLNKTDLINQLNREKRIIQTPLGIETLYSLVKSAGKIEGDIVEVGVYKGGSAKIICEAKENKVLHLFDTFEGFPKPTEVDDNTFSEGEFKESLENVKQYLIEYENVYFYKGVFPNTAQEVEDKHFSFVHLDVDLHKGTLDCLKFFYPRMNIGGMIISHDYPFKWVRDAFEEFFKDKPEPIILITRS